MNEGGSRGGGEGKREEVKVKGVGVEGRGGVLKNKKERKKGALFEEGRPLCSPYFSFVQFSGSSDAAALVSGWLVPVVLASNILKT